ncbi:MAG: 7-carboxy-7-deazaguanine synthase QueE [Bryobacterales bacterium]|nr:7-carboxy-7-deazaguanine synthase QueE [Bryobacteraceae bacterium]MDW8130804.1 7-carboxy-7-deazaguanine synthase QueE [Bryobacterales bacterium]
MKIAEIFYSVQGEGILLGVPSVFIRASGCNLRCAWCDTPYASWVPEGEDWPTERILEEVRRHPARHVVITGGEPMIMPDVVELTEALARARLHLTIETAGTVFKPVRCDLMSISPKLSNSTPHERDGGRWVEQHERLRIQPLVLRRLMSDYDYQLKFVVTAPEDLAEIRGLVRELGADPARVLLMPEGTDGETLRRRAEWIIEICKQEGFRYTPRLQIEIWGARRGV